MDNTNYTQRGPARLSDADYCTLLFLLGTDPEDIPASLIERARAEGWTWTD